MARKPDMQGYRGGSPEIDVLLHLHENGPLEAGRLIDGAMPPWYPKRYLRPHYARALARCVRWGEVQTLTEEAIRKDLDIRDKERFPSCALPAWKPGLLDLTDNGYRRCVSILGEEYARIRGGWNIDDKAKMVTVVGQSRLACFRYVGQLVNDPTYHLGLSSYVYWVSDCVRIGKWRLNRFEVLASGWIVKLRYRT
jgi:hypothetical protein